MSMFGSSFKTFKGKNSDFSNNKKMIHVGNVKAMGIFNPSVQTLEKRNSRPRNQLGMVRNQLRVRKKMTW